MKSIKPGRGPSMMESAGAIAAAVFGVIWTVAAASMGAPWFMSAFGVIFIILAVVSALYNAHNATGKNRFSILDITDENEEPDPLERISRTEEKTGTGRSGSRFCPFCGTAVRDDFEFCDQCGKKLP